MQIYIKVTDVDGRGLYAVQDLQAHKILFTCELLVLSERDTEVVNQTELQFYTFKFNEKQDCLVLGHGELFNHSSAPNVGYKLMDFDGRRVMAFYLLRDVSQNEQLYIDYNADVAVDTGAYKINLVG